MFLTAPFLKGRNFRQVSLVFAMSLLVFVALASGSSRSESPESWCPLADLTRYPSLPAKGDLKQSHVDMLKDFSGLTRKLVKFTDLDTAIFARQLSAGWIGIELREVCIEMNEVSANGTPLQLFFVHQLERLPPDRFGIHFEKVYFSSPAKLVLNHPGKYSFRYIYNVESIEMNPAEGSVLSVPTRTENEAVRDFPRTQVNSIVVDACGTSHSPNRRVPLVSLSAKEVALKCVNVDHAHIDADHSYALEHAKFGELSSSDFVMSSSHWTEFSFSKTSGATNEATLCAVRGTGGSGALGFRKDSCDYRIELSGSSLALHAMGYAKPAPDTARLTRLYLGASTITSLLLSGLNMSEADLRIHFASLEELHLERLTYGSGTLMTLEPSENAASDVFSTTRVFAEGRALPSFNQIKADKSIKASLASRLYSVMVKDKSHPRAVIDRMGCSYRFYSNPLSSGALPPSCDPFGSADDQ